MILRETSNGKKRPPPSESEDRLSESVVHFEQGLIEIIPPEAWLMILSLLEAEDLLNVSTTCRFLSNLASDASIWLQVTTRLVNELAHQPEHPMKYHFLLQWPPYQDTQGERGKQTANLKGWKRRFFELRSMAQLEQEPPGDENWFREMWKSRIKEIKKDNQEKTTVKKAWKGLGKKLSSLSRSKRHLTLEQLEEEDKATNVLLLGGQNSGKSTFYSHSGIVFGVPMKDRVHFRVGVRRNIIKDARTLVEEAQKRNILVKSAQRVEDIDEWGKSYKFESTVETVEGLLQERAIVDLCQQHLPYFDPYRAQYFFSKLQSLVEEDFDPSSLDILYARGAKARKILAIKELNPEGYDGVVNLLQGGSSGQELLKSLAMYGEADILIYTVNLMGFIPSYDDQMKKSLAVLESLAGMERFEKVPVFLVFTHLDGFKRVLLDFDLSAYFPNYSGGRDYQQSLEFVVSEFENATKNSIRAASVHSFSVCTLKWKDVCMVWDAILVYMFERKNVK